MIRSTDQPHPGGLKGRGALAAEQSRWAGHYPSDDRSEDIPASGRERAEGFLRSSDCGRSERERTEGFRGSVVFDYTSLPTDD